MSGRDALGARKSTCRKSVMPRNSIANRSDGGLTSVARPRSSSAEGKRRTQTHPDLADKASQKQTKQEIIAFLVEFGFFQRTGDGISMQKLSNITQREFFAYFRFIFAQIYESVPDELLPGAEACEYIMANLKTLKYPYQFTTSYMQAVGSQVYAPHVFAMLGWLVGQARYFHETLSIRIQDARTGGTAEEGSLQHTRAWRHMYETGYKAWLDGGEEGGEGSTMDQILTDKCTRITAESEASIKEHKQKLAEIEAELQAAREMPDNLMVVMAETKALEDMLACEVQLVNDCKAGAEIQRAEIAAAEANLLEQEEKTRQLEETLAEIESQIASQPMQMEEVSQINDERMTLKNRVVELNAHFAKVRAERRERKLQDERQFTELREVAFEYNKLLAAEKLTPPTMKNANGIKYVVTLNQDGLTPDTLLGCDMERISTGLKALIVQYRDKKVHCRQQAMYLTDQLSTIQHSEAQCNDCMRVIEEKHQAAKVSRASMQAKYAQEMQHLQDQISQVTAHNKELLGNAEESTASAVRDMETEKRAFEVEKKAFYNDLTERRRWLGKQVNRIVEHKGRMDHFHNNIKEGIHMEELAREHIIHKLDAIIQQPL